jgi:type I restriction-modification system DNA methylase subunit
MSSQAPPHQKLLRQLTLQSATAALLTFGAETNPTAQDIAHIKELADEYAFRAIVLWLLSKLVRHQSMADAAERTFFQSDEYPFLNCLNADSFQVFRQEAFNLLDGTDASAETLGAYYEHIQKFSLEFDFASNRFEWQSREDKSARRAVGQFYTPAKVVDYCWRKLLLSLDYPFTADIGSDFGPESGAGKMPAVQGVEPILRIFDPSCGTGNFLLGYLRVAREQRQPNVPPGRRRYKAADLVSVATSALHGADIDGRAVSLCRVGIIITVLSASRVTPSTTGDISKKTEEL